MASQTTPKRNNKIGGLSVFHLSIIIRTKRRPADFVLSGRKHEAGLLKTDSFRLHN